MILKHRRLHKRSDWRPLQIVGLSSLQIDRHLLCKSTGRLSLQIDHHLRCKSTGHLSLQIVFSANRRCLLCCSSRCFVIFSSTGVHRSASASLITISASRKRTVVISASINRSLSSDFLQIQFHSIISSKFFCRSSFIRLSSLLLPLLALLLLLFLAPSSASEYDYKHGSSGWS